MPESSAPKDRPGFFRLLIPADLAEVSRCRKLMEEVGRQAGLPEPRIFDLQVTVSEAAANAIEHAASEVVIEAWVLADRLIVEVTNDGVFQPGLVKNEDTRRRGLGLPLMVSLADYVQVSRLDTGKTQVSLTFFLEGYRHQVSGPARKREIQPGDVESLYRNLVELSPDAVLVHVDGVYVFVNPAAAKLFGAGSPDELIGLRAIERLHPDDRELLVQRMSRVLAGGIGPPVEGRMLRLDGTPISVESTGSRVQFGKSLGVQAIIRDVTERKRAEEQLAYQALLLGEVGDAIRAVDENFIITYWNKAAENLFGWTAEEAIGKPTEDVLQPWEPTPDRRQSIEQIREAGGYKGDVLYRRRNGTAVLVEARATVLGGPDGEFKGSLTVFTDITERKGAEEALQQQARLLDLSSDAIFAWEADGAIIYWNQGAESLYGFTSEEAVGRVSHELLKTVHPQGFAQFRTALERAGEWLGEVTHTAKEGQTLVVETRQQVVQRGDRRLVLEINRDITERTRAERERERLLAEEQALNEELASQTEELLERERSLRESEERFRSVLDSSLDGLYRVNLQTGRYDYMSPAFGPIIRRSNEEFAHLSPETSLRLVHPDDLPQVLAALGQTGAAAEVEYRIAGSDGEYRWISNHFSQSTDAEGRPLYRHGVVRDITERRRAEEALRASEERFRLMFERHGAVMLLIDPAAGAIVDANMAATRFYGRSRDELCALTIHDLNRLPPEQVAAEYQKAAAEERSHFEFPHLAAGAETRWVDVHSVPIEVQGRKLLFSIIQDITERKRAEEDLQQSEEQQSFLLNLSDTVRSLEDPKELQAVAARALGERLAVDRVFYADIVAENEREYLVIERDYHTPGLPDVRGRIPMSLYSDRDNSEYRAGRTVWSSDMEADPKVTESERRAYRANGTRSYVGVPIIKQGNLAAVLGIVHRAPREWRPAEITFAERAADRIWRELERARAESGLRESEERYRRLAAENERLYRQQLDIAENLQGALLDIPSELGPVRIGHLYRSATEAARVGGDFYDVFKAKAGQIALLIGDVSGHGLEAARVATLVKDIVHAFAHQFRRPHLVLRETSRLLVEKNLTGFVTAFLGILDPETGILVYSSAGHPPPVLLDHGQAEPLMSASLPLGVFADARYRDVEVDVQDGARLLLYTDGLTEARRNGDFFGETRLAEALVRTHAARIEELPSLLLDEALDFSGGTLVDDVALLAVDFPRRMGVEGR
jgi:PAS domain S-box-containing protein